MFKYQGYPDRELVLLLHENDTDALSALYYQHVKQLTYFVLKASKSTELAEDIVQDTFLKIWGNRWRIDPEQPFKPYLYTVARMHLLNLVKRAKHEHSIVEEIKRNAITQEFSTDLLVAYRESNALINQAIKTLPKQCKEVFLRCKIQGLSHKQAAEELGISESTVNNQIGKALKNIKAFLAESNGLCLFLAILLK
ncbi:RNA polymerase sigma-70 factor [Pedobacter gandavensis]|uniref:RNA polymerase sigma factor n=1 Tax=Pedobacter gandavensis TaxID=2679963 RepID=UPI00292E3FC6|nr:RNA polymerase sigma-70 factor [Pedobacter gandavensis]